ncbi:MAG: transcriptional regulator NrdR [Christensenellaceae bacterium]|jgi:transcriptional repressor NrdR|nr:transcriptional regulator NrdR [Christensenellaceae bacterium]
MKCLYCNSTESRVLDTRQTDEGSVIRRRRECTACGRRFTTFETIEQTPIMVIKKDGRRESFNPDKIRSGLVKACEKRPIAASDMDRLVRDIETQVYNSLVTEIPTSRIGDMVMERLRELDEVAYVRFAAVYRSFCDIDTFLEELERLRGAQREETERA